MFNVHKGINIGKSTYPNNEENQSNWEQQIDNNFKSWREQFNIGTLHTRFQEGDQWLAKNGLPVGVVGKENERENITIKQSIKDRILGALHFGDHW